MIDAKQCREESKQNQISLQRKEVEKKIRSAVLKGRTKITYAGRLFNEIQQELSDAGFKVGNGIIEW